MAKSNELDLAVMIVGGGPAGISTWMHLQREAPQLAGRSIVIEKAVFPRDKLCAGGLCAWAVDVLAYLSVEAELHPQSSGGTESSDELPRMPV
jgi:menaquinone-9 beta-reductase